MDAIRAPQSVPFKQCSTALERSSFQRAARSITFGAWTRTSCTNVAYDPIAYASHSSSVGQLHAKFWKAVTDRESFEQSGYGKCSYKRRSLICKAEAEARDTRAQPKGTSATLCLFPVTIPYLPTAVGTLRLFEPKYMQMMEVIAEVAARAGGVPRFGLFLRGSHAFLPRITMTGFDTVGCCCEVERQETTPEGHLLVQWSAVSRCRVAAIEKTQPFHVATVEWVGDLATDQPGASSGARVDRLERDTWEALREVVGLTSKLQAGAAAGGRGRQPGSPEPPVLSSALRRFAPSQPPAWAPPLTHVSRRGQADIEVWRSSRAAPGGVAPRQVSAPDRSSATCPSPADAPSNPYWLARETFAKPARQEAFSFAAANTVEAGPKERTQLLEMRDTGARLAWVLEAVEPHLASLRAKYALMRAYE